MPEYQIPTPTTPPARTHRVLELSAGEKLADLQPVIDEINQTCPVGKTMRVTITVTRHFRDA